MKLVLLNPSPPGISAFGVRSLSSFLRSRGHEVVVVFFPGSLGLLKEDGAYSYKYSQEVIAQVAVLCQKADLIGVSFFTNYLDRALQLTERLHAALDVPIIWGGIHASTKPEEALRYADMVCIGEGELSLLDLLDRLATGKEYYDIPGIWFKDGERIIKNALRPLIADLDSLPFFDFSNIDHYILNPRSKRIEVLTDKILQETTPLMPDRSGRLLRTYRTMTDRGCPHRCTYCNVPTLKRLYQDDRSPFLRSRTPEKVVDELVWTLERFSFIKAIHIFDDTFFARPLSYIKRFSQLYKAKVGLPMYCQASPNTLIEEKLRLLVDAGLIYVEMGIQTGSARIREMYARNESNEQILAAAQLLNNYRRHLIPPDYHIILDNPWETEEDTLETVRLLHRLPKPFGLAISSLVFYPKTELYERALREGMVHDEMKEISLKPFYIPPQKTYLHLLVYLVTFPSFPRKLMGILIRDSVVMRASRVNLSLAFKMIYFLGEMSRLLQKGLRALLRGDMQRLYLYYEKIRLGDPVVAGRKGK